MTLVVDTDDPKGIDHAWEMIAILQKKAGRNPTAIRYTKEFGKIEYIKSLRKYVREQADALKDADDDTVGDIKDMQSLRNTKQFADRIFNGEK
ncbi:MAG TPA: hypothetical protein EYN67_03640 [Flavobacteriales bacterium]|nr:hypothetical protein [Flavobacteriales bacterium]